MAGIFRSKGVWSMGFDMQPTGSNIFNLGGSTTNVGAIDTSVTPYNFGCSWKLSNQFSIIGFGANLVTHYNGLWVKLSALPSTNQRILSWYDATAAAYQLNLRVYSDGHFQFCTGSSATTIGSASAAGLIVANTWIHLQTKVVIDASSGVAELIVNDDGTHSKAIADSGVVTKQTANTWASGLELNSVTSGTANYDDWWMLDGSAASPLNSYLGVVQCKGEKPSSNSAVSGRNAWTPTNPQNDNHLNVGNAPPSSTQYNADQNPGDYDMFGFPTLNTGATVYFVNAWATLGLDSGGTRTVVLDCYSGGTDATGSSYTPPAIASPGFISEPFIVDPNTGSAWTTSAAQAAELGVKVTS